MKDLGYYNGKYDLIEKMTVPMNDRAMYFGDGVYDATYSHNHKILFIDEHIDRFFNSAKLLRIELPYTKEEMKSLLYEMEAKVDGGSCFVYWEATRGTGPRNHMFPTEGKANILITMTPKTVTDLSEKINCITVEDTRFLHCNIKTLNLIPSVMAAQKASEAGCQEAIFHRGALVTECAHSNVSIINNNMLITHPTDHLILPGIGRAHLIKAAKAIGIGVDETNYSVNDLMNAQEIIVSSSGTFAIGVKEVNKRPVGGRAAEILSSLQEYLIKEFVEDTKA